MKIQVKGIIIKETNLGESDKSVRILTPEFGIINAIIKRCKNLKNKNTANVQLLSYCNFSVYMGKNTYIIDQCEIIELFWGVQKSLDTLALAQYFCELTSSLNPDKEIADCYLKLFLNTLYYLSYNKMNQQTLKYIFELRTCSMCGYMPDLTGCYKCKKYDIENSHFFINHGRLLCSNCYSVNDNFEKNILLENATLSALRYIIYSPIEKIFNFKMSNDLNKFISSICEEYILTHLGSGFKALNFYKTIS